MRTYGRIAGSWVQVTDPEQVWITTLIQVLKLGLGESPFYANYGIPAQQSVVTQVYPDYYVARTQQYFAQYFRSLQITRVPHTLTPTYNVNLVTLAGTYFGQQVAT